MRIVVRTHGTLTNLRFCWHQRLKLAKQSGKHLSCSRQHVRCCHSQIETCFSHQLLKLALKTCRCTQYDLIRRGNSGTFVSGRNKYCYSAKWWCRATPAQTCLLSSLTDIIAALAVTTTTLVDLLLRPSQGLAILLPTQVMHCNHNLKTISLTMAHQQAFAANQEVSHCKYVVIDGIAASCSPLPPGPNTAHTHTKL